MLVVGRCSDIATKQYVFHFEHVWKGVWIYYVYVYDIRNK